MANVKNVLGLLVGVTLCVAPTAWAQSTGTEKLFVDINFGQQGVPDTRVVRASLSKFPIYSETATLTSEQPVNGGFVFDIGARYLVWNKLSAGLVLWRYSDTETATTETRVPDPVFFARPLTVRGTTDDLKRTEQGVALTASWSLQLMPRLTVTPSVGVSVVKAKQETIGDFDIQPRGTQAVVLTTTTVQATGTGPYVGVDGTYMLTRFGRIGIGVGGYFRFARAKKDLGSNADAEIGGAQGGGGIRLRF